MNLNDRQLEQLLRHAGEAEDAHRAWEAGHARGGGGVGRVHRGAANGPSDVVVFGARDRVFWRGGVGLGVGGWMAAAAGLGLAVGLAVWASRPSGGAPAGRGGAMAHVDGRGRGGAAVSAGETPVPGAEDDPFLAAEDPGAGPARADAVVLTIVPDDRGELKCVRWASGPWGGTLGQKLADVHADELRAMGLGMVCEHTAPKVLVVGLEGPAEMLPTSDARAADLARCILKTPRGSLPSSSEVCTPGTCMPATVRMRMEAVVMR